MTFPFPIVAPFSTPATIAYCDEDSSESNLTTYTFTSVGIGTAAADRFVLCAAMAPANSGTRSFSSVTIGGISATQLVTVADASGFSEWAIYGASVPTGTTATIVVVLDTAPDRCGIMTFEANNLQSTTPTATATQNTASAALTQSITVQSDGFILACAGIENSASRWGWTNLTEDIDADIGSGGSSMTAASDEYDAGATPSITATPTSTGSRQGLVMVAMR